MRREKNLLRVLDDHRTGSPIWQKARAELREIEKRKVKIKAVAKKVARKRKSKSRQHQYRGPRYMHRYGMTVHDISFLLQSPVYDIHRFERNGTLKRMIKIVNMRK